MTEELTGDPITFDLIGAIEGTTYPETEVRFYFDARAAQQIHGMNKRLTLLGALGRTEEYEELEPQFFQAIEDLKDKEYIVTVRGVPREVKKAWVAKAQAKHPDKKPNKDGYQEPNVAGMAYVQLLQWQSHIVSIANPEGKVNTGPFEESVIESLLNRAPDASLAAVAEAIEELDTGTKSGYEEAVRNRDFLSEPSPEESLDSSPAPSE